MMTNKTILITGGCGYIGSQLLRDLAVDDRFSGCTIRILDNMQEKNYRALMNLPAEGCFDFMEGDILDPAAVRYALRDVDAVVHLAAVVRTPMSFENPSWVEQVNHWGTARLVESCLDAGITRMLFASSTAVYGPGGPFTEKDMCRPFGAYAQSKYRAETKILAAVQRGLNPMVLRFGTVFGIAPVMRFDAVANRFAYLAGTGRSLTVFGQGDQVRPFIHVRDVSAAIRFGLTIQGNLPGNVFNVCGPNASVLELVETLQSINPQVRVHYTEQDVLTHLSIEVDSSRFQSLGWSSRVSLLDGLKDLTVRFVGKVC